ncbi:MAG: hypothetical protein LBO69_06985 [Ignavibacteria bacterium]|jgi:YbbR domain-containing protein|nr:hypothetical protein [Ignavibacteria bacterium]
MEIKRWYYNKSFWGSLLVAIALWIYASLNDEYQSTIDVPLQVKAPTGRAIEDVLPTKISIDVKGNGWSLFNYLYLNSIKLCKVNLDDASKADSIYVVHSVDMQKGLEGINKLVIRRFYPDSLRVRTGEVSTKTVNITPNVNIIPRQGFVIVGDVRTEPTAVSITGNTKLIDSILSWKTIMQTYTDVTPNLNSDASSDKNARFSRTIAVSDSMASVIKIKPKNVTIFAPIQQYGEVTFHDVKINVIGGQLPSDNVLLPQLFTVTLSGGIELLSKINASEIILSLDYNAIMNDSNGILIPKVDTLPYTKVINIYPKYIQHKKIITNTTNL